MKKLILTVLALSLIRGSCLGAPNSLLISFAEATLAPVAAALGAALSDLI